MSQTEEEKDERRKLWKKGGRRITLKYAGTCDDCGAALAVGDTARWYGRGRIFGLHCHGLFDPEPEATPEADPERINPLGEPERPPEPVPSEGYDCTRNPFEKPKPEPGFKFEFLH